MTVTTVLDTIMFIDEELVVVELLQATRVGEGGFDKFFCHCKSTKSSYKYQRDG